ncbi:MAG: heavy metal translocating P-type ATPase metal-binding domain-containing protein, partial [Flavobacteriales bacterium]
MAVITEQERCYHCGEACGSDPVKAEGKNFCCDGCKMVFELLSENNLCTYYNLDNTPGISPKILNFQGKYAFLDDPQTAEKIIRFQDESHVHVQFYLPQMHCSSCVWLLEHLYKLNQGITSSRVDFLRKEVSIEYSKDQTTLRKVVELLASIGYAPSLSLDQLENKAAAKPNRARIYRIAVAGFCFSNIMLLSFPEYFNIGVTGELGMIRMFNYLNLALSLPVLVYSGGEFFISAWQGIKARFLNIDIPLALSIAITFGRSLYEIISGTGAGYLDSMSGIIFFMLLGRYFQEKTYSNLQFDRNFKSYFPISVSVLGKEGETTIPLSQLKPGQRILIRSQEIVPADSRLLSGKAYIDYSFVTGESEPV